MTKHKIKTKKELTRRRPAAAGLAAGPVASAAVVVFAVVLVSSLGGLPAIPEPEPCEDVLPVRGL